MVAGRRLGKTWTMIRWLLEQPNERVILTSNQKRRHHIIETIMDLDTVNCLPRRYWEARVYIPDPIQGYSMSLRGLCREVGIDDAEEVLRNLFHVDIGFVTMNATLMPTPSGPRPEPFVDGECYDPRQQEGQSIYGIRPHKYPRNSAELERLKALAAEPITPERLRQLRDELGMDDGN